MRDSNPGRAKTPRSALGSTLSPIYRVTGVRSLGVKQSGREVGHLPPSSAEITRVELGLFCPICLHGVDRDSFAFIMVNRNVWGSCCIVPLFGLCWSLSIVCDSGLSVYECTMPTTFGPHTR
jgi:hypothetical protein